MRGTLDAPSNDDEWSAYSSGLGRKFLKLDVNHCGLTRPGIDF